jgi:hypothetical protein
MTLRNGIVTTLCALPGSASFGDRCIAATDCAAGLVCIGNQCRRLCCATETDPCPMSLTRTDARCQVDIGLTSAGVLACGAVCDWRASTCGAGATCIPLDASGATSDCIVAGRGGDGTTCRHLSDCMQGFACVNDGGLGYVCRAICDTANDTCTSGYACQPVSDRPAGFGVCSPPL